MGTLLPIQQSLVAPPQPVVIKPLGSYRTKPLLSGMVQRIRDLPTGCKSCGRQKINKINTNKINTNKI